VNIDFYTSECPKIGYSIFPSIKLTNTILGTIQLKSCWRFGWSNHNPCFVWNWNIFCACLSSIVLLFF